MPLPDFYPPAKRRLAGNAAGKWSGKGNWKVVWHTTETAGLPGYKDGKLAPHLTYIPAQRKWVQDFPLSRPAESVKDFDDDQIIQVEVVCYSAKRIADESPSRLWVGHLEDVHYRDLADFATWVTEHVKIPAKWPGKQAFSFAEANAPGFRLTKAEFHEFGGHLGHQHTPAPNDHWDPGAFDWNKLMSKIEEETMTPTQARLEIAAGWHSRAGVWMTPDSDETAPQRLTRLAQEVVDGKRTVEEIVRFAGEPRPQTSEPVPAWVLDPFATDVPIPG